MANIFNTVREEVQGLNNLPAGQAPIPSGLRSTASPETSFDVGGSTDQDGLLNHPFSPGITRQLWMTPPVVTRPPVTSIRQSATQVSSENGAYRAGLLLNPITTLATMSTIPDMSVPLQTSGNQVNLAFQGSFMVSTASATMTFAIYRDGQQVGRAYPMVQPTANVPFLVSLTAGDSPVNGVHAYSAQWATSAGTLTAAGYARTFLAQNHRAQ